MFNGHFFRSEFHQTIPQCAYPDILIVILYNTGYTVGQKRDFLLFRRIEIAVYGQAIIQSADPQIVPNA